MTNILGPRGKRPVTIYIANTELCLYIMQEQNASASIEGGGGINQANGLRPSKQLDAIKTHHIVLRTPRKEVFEHEPEDADQLASFRRFCF